MLKPMLVLLFYPVRSVLGHTPHKSLIIKQLFDDAVSLDRVQCVELFTVQGFNRLFQRLLQSTPNNLIPVSANQWRASADTQD